MKYAQPVGKGCEKMLAKPDRIWYHLMARALGTAYQGGPLPQCLRGKNVSCKGRIIMDLIKTLTANYMKPELPQMNVGDTVRIMETRPLSKTKRWRLVQIIERAK